MVHTLSECFLPYLNTQSVESVAAFTSEIQSKGKELVVAKSVEPSTLLRYAAECVHEFVEINWSCAVRFVAEEVSQTFGIDGCNLPPFTKNPQLLLIARAIFGAFADLVNDYPNFLWAQIRAVALYQWLLDEPSHTIRGELEALISFALSNEKFLAFARSQSLEVVFLLECFQYFRLCNARKQATECLEKATALSGITISFASALGKRTRFQTESSPQLYVRIEATEHSAEGSVKENKTAFEAVDPSLLPSNLSIEEDVYLNEVKFENPESQIVGHLTSANQALVLAKCMQYADSLPKEDNFLKEEVAAFLQVVLKNPVEWGIQYHALYLRSLWEQMGTSSRKLDRAMRQLDHLSSDEAFKFFHKLNENGDNGDWIDKLEHRFKVFQNFFAALPPAPWTVQRTLGDLLNRMGAVASALDIYERLHSWPDVIKAYTRLERREKAESLIRSQLSKGRTPEMLVYLGDCTGEKIHYEEAWELSKGRCSKAQRNLGFLMAQNKEFAAAASCFQKSLAINPLQVAIWFAYGCVGFALEDFEMAATGFFKCTQLDNENGEAWSNLATSYIKLNQKRRAVCILQEAIRCQFDNWRLWENYLLITVDCGVFDEAIRAMHRLIDIRGKFSDSDVLEIVSRAVCDNIKDGSDQPSIKHRTALLELFGRILATSSPGAKVSRYHADVILAGSETKPEDVHRAISSLQRAIRCHLQAPSSSWNLNDFEVVKGVLEDSLHLHNTFTRYSALPESAAELNSLKVSLKYMFQSVSSRVSNTLRDVESNNENRELLESLLKMSAELEAALKNY